LKIKKQKIDLKNRNRRNKTLKRRIPQNNSGDACIFDLGANNAQILELKF
jgi:hypothetical protein